MITIYDMASGVIRKTSANTSKANNADVSQGQPQDTSKPDHSLYEEQLELREYNSPETTRDNVNILPPELASVHSDQFIKDMEK